METTGIHGLAERTRHEPNGNNIMSSNDETYPRDRGAVTTFEPFDSIDQPSQHAVEAESRYPTGIKFYVLMLAVAMTLVLGGLDASIVATIVPTITDEFSTIADVGWYNVAYRLPLCAFQFIFGKLYKLFSIKRIFITSQIVFLLGSLICATAASSKIFVFGRALTGLAAASILSGAFTLLILTVPLRLRPMYTGLFGATETVAVMAAPVIGGLLTEKLS